jgi:hypothetical protein
MGGVRGIQFYRFGRLSTGKRATLLLNASHCGSRHGRGGLSLRASEVHPDKQDSAVDSIAVTVDGKPFTTYRYGAAVNKPYLAPALASSKHD